MPYYSKHHPLAQKFSARNEVHSPHGNNINASIMSIQIGASTKKSIYIYISKLNLVFSLSMKSKNNHTFVITFRVMLLNDEASGCHIWDVGLKFTLYGSYFFDIFGV